MRTRRGFRMVRSYRFSGGTGALALSIQRTFGEGPFKLEHKHALAPLARRLTETATLSKAVGCSVISGITNALDLFRNRRSSSTRTGLSWTTIARRIDCSTAISGFAIAACWFATRPPNAAWTLFSLRCALHPTRARWALRPSWCAGQTRHRSSSACCRSPAPRATRFSARVHYCCCQTCRCDKGPRRASYQWHSA